jgi:multimeric flavodoxin WrbA
VIFGSHRLGGANQEIESMLKDIHSIHQFDFIHMADHEVKGCVSCHLCAKSGRCVLPESDADHFQEIFDKLITAGAIFIITPVYALIPSRLTALFERLTSVLYDTGRMNTDRNPLLNKKVAIFNYCSTKICDETELKVIFQKFVMKDYSFTDVTYNYLNDSERHNSYESITEYVKDVAMSL